MILTEKMQKYQHYHLKKIDKYEHFTGEEILSSDQRRMIASSVYLFSFRESFKRAKRND